MALPRSLEVTDVIKVRNLSLFRVGIPRAHLLSCGIHSSSYIQHIYSNLIPRYTIVAFSYPALEATEFMGLEDNVTRPSTTAN